MIKIFNLLKNFSFHLFVKLPSPLNLSYLWNIGSILLIILIFQLLTGVVLTFFYTADSSLAFFSIEYLARIRNNGILFRWLHINRASFFFMFIYFHMFRGLYFNSFNLKDTWNTGIRILLLLIAIAFIGYVLPWGQISFWAATVITKFFSVIPYVGLNIIYWIWSGFRVNNLTLKFFFSLHFLLPLILLVFVFLHLIVLHFKGSFSPIFNSSYFLKIMFSPFFLFKDILNILFYLFLFFLINIWISGESVNFIEANFVSSPAHIKPEWYFLFAYAILRSIPQKLAGVIIIGVSLLIFYLFSLQNNFINLGQFKVFNKIWFFFFFANFILLSWIGGNPVTDLFVIIGQLGSLLYFLLLLHFLFLLKISYFLK